MMGMVEDAMRRKLSEALAPQVLEIENESHRHAGHAGSPGTGESHFRLRIISTAFAGLNRVDRQRLVYSILADELKGPVHALAVRAVTPEESGGS